MSMPFVFVFLFALKCAGSAVNKTAIYWQGLEQRIVEQFPGGELFLMLFFGFALICMTGGHRNPSYFSTQNSDRTEYGSGRFD